MLFLVKRFAKIGLNTHPFSEDDFYRICRNQRPRIKVIEYPLTSAPGFYMRCKGKPYIAIDSRRRGVARMYILWHELAHYFLHVPPHANGVHWFRLTPNTKQEFEAEVFAVVAMLPEPLLRKILADGGNFDEHGFTREIVTFRLRVLRLYGI